MCVAPHDMDPQRAYSDFTSAVSCFPITAMNVAGCMLLFPLYAYCLGTAYLCHVLLCPCLFSLKVWFVRFVSSSQSAWQMVERASGLWQYIYICFLSACVHVCIQVICDI